MAAMRHMEEEWAHIQDNGPPDMATVLQHLLPRENDIALEDDLEQESTQPMGKGLARKRRVRKLKDDRSDSLVKEDFDLARKGDKYSQMLAARTRLPAFKSESEFIQLLSSHRCVIVVGETGTCLPFVFISINADKT